MAGVWRSSINAVICPGFGVRYASDPRMCVRLHPTPTRKEHGSPPIPQRAFYRSGRLSNLFTQLLPQDCATLTRFRFADHSLLRDL